MTPAQGLPVLVTGATGRVGRLVWTAPPTTVQEVVERVAAHTRRVVFLSSPHQTPHPFFQQPNPMAVLHADIERNIAAAGLESTTIRPGMRIIGDVLGRRITFEELTPDEFRSETESTWPRPVVNMLLDAWGATIRIPAFVTSTVFDLLGSVVITALFHVARP